MSETYQQLLQKPAWQRKKNKILERDNYSCRFCGNEHETLHAHHIQYLQKNGQLIAPWEYPDLFLITLCSTCHEKETIHAKLAYKRLICHFAQMGFSHADIEHLNTLFEGKKKQSLFTKFRLFVLSLYKSVKNG